MDTARQRAREQQRALDLRRLHYHQKLVGLLLGKRTQRAVLSRAWREVRRWKRRGLCSQDYIHEWSRLLAGPVPTLVILMLDESPTGVKLRQNSPFWFIMKIQK